MLAGITIQPSMLLVSQAHLNTKNYAPVRSQDLKVSSFPYIAHIIPRYLTPPIINVFIFLGK